MMEHTFLSNQNIIYRPFHQSKLSNHTLAPKAPTQTFKPHRKVDRMAAPMPPPSASSAAPQGRQGAPPAQVYSFPLLKPTEIFACVREMRIPVEAEEIRACDPGAVRRVLEVFIESVMGLTREEMNQPKFTGLGALSYPEIHQESIPELTFFRAAKKLMAACGVDDFGLKDVLAPTPKRVRRQLSALINFAKFREERLAAFSGLNLETERLLKHKAALAEQNAALQRELDQLEAENAAEAPELEQVKQDVAELEAQINVRNNEQARLKYEATELRTQNQALKDELSSMDFMVADAAETVDKLRAQIVTSPGRVKDEVRRVAVQLEAVKEELHGMERRHRELLAQSDVFARAEKEVQKTLALMAEIDKDMANCKDAKEQVKQLKRQFQGLRDRTLETVNRHKRIDKAMQIKKEEFERFKEEARVKDRAADQTLQLARADLGKLKKTHEAQRRVIADSSEARAELERKTREDELNYQKELHDLQQVSRCFGGGDGAVQVDVVGVSNAIVLVSIDVLAAAARGRVLQQPAARGHPLGVVRSR